MVLTCDGLIQQLHGLHAPASRSHLLAGLREIMRRGQSHWRQIWSECISPGCLSSESLQGSDVTDSFRWRFGSAERVSVHMCFGGVVTQSESTGATELKPFALLHMES